jgi:hypothetical protein
MQAKLLALFAFYKSNRFECWDGFEKHCFSQPFYKLMSYP